VNKCELVCINECLPLNQSLMPATGYSGTPLIKKLGIAENMKVLLINAPENYFDLIEKNISAQLINKKNNA
jgi:hypothetical protein